MLPLIAAILPASSTAAAAADGATLMVVEKKANQVGFYTSAGERAAGVAVGETPHEMALSADGRYAYVSDNGVLWMDYEGPGGNTVSVIDIAARKRIGILPLGKFHRPHGIGLDPTSSRAFITSENPDRLVLADLDALAVIRDFDNGGADPHMVTFDSRGEWGYVSNTASGTVGAVHAVTGELRTIPVGKGPQGSLLSRDGKHAFAGVQDSDQIWIVSVPRRTVVQVIDTPKGAGPDPVMEIGQYMPPNGR